MTTLNMPHFSTTRPKKWLLLVALVIAAITWWWPKPVPPATLGFYASQFCHLTSRLPDLSENQFITMLKRSVHANNSGYSLSQREFDPKAADIVIKRWHTLNAKQQQQARQDSQQCLHSLVPEIK